MLMYIVLDSGGNLIKAPEENYDYTPMFFSEGSANQWAIGLARGDGFSILPIVIKL